MIRPSHPTTTPSPPGSIPDDTPPQSWSHHRRRCRPSCRVRRRAPDRCPEPGAGAPGDRHRTPAHAVRVDPRRGVAVTNFGHAKPFVIHKGRKDTVMDGYLSPRSRPGAHTAPAGGHRQSHRHAGRGRWRSCWPRRVPPGYSATGWVSAAAMMDRNRCRTGPSCCRTGRKWRLPTTCRRRRTARSSR